MTSADATVLVLGGAGSVGTETVHQLARRNTFRRILVADRVGAEAAGIDVADTPALVALMRRAQVVLNATGPFGTYGLPVVQAALAAQVHYADVNDEVEPLQELFGTDTVDHAARAAEVTLVVGLGMSPGMTNIIARYGAQPLDRVSAVHSLVAGESFMTYALTIDQKPTYLHAIVIGRNSRENVVRYLEEILHECTARRCFRVLIEERLEGPRLGMLEVFEIASEGSSRAFGMLKAIAYVDVNAEGDLMQFAETVAVNRALPVTVFSTVPDAEKWLMGKDRGDPEPHAAADADRPRR